MFFAVFFPPNLSIPLRASIPATATVRASLALYVAIAPAPWASPCPEPVTGVPTGILPNFTFNPFFA